jgi:XTP/dITP diphosphohydrolase
MRTLRTGCPWDAEQTHASLVAYLIEETAETVEAIEAGDDAALREELGDLLFEVVFHAQLGSERGAFTLDDLARQVGDKLIARHPYVFADGPVPDDLMGSWEQRKRIEKARASAVDGVPEPLSALARAGKVVSRIRHHGVPVALPDQLIDAATLGQAVVALVARAQASGVDADQAVRRAVRQLEAEVRSAEAGVMAQG